MSRLFGSISWLVEKVLFYPDKRLCRWLGHKRYETKHMKYSFCKHCLESLWDVETK